MKAIRHAGIVVSDLDKALCFYRDLLGLKIIKKMEESGDYIDNISGFKGIKVTTVKMAADDGNLIELLHYKSHHRMALLRKDICEIGISHVAFTVGDIDKEYLKLKKAGIEFNHAPQISPDGYAKVTFCRDYDNNLVELVEVLRP